MKGVVFEKLGLNHETTFDCKLHSSFSYKSIEICSANMMIAMISLSASLLICQRFSREREIVIDDKIHYKISIL